MILTSQTLYNGQTTQNHSMKIFILNFNSLLAYVFLFTWALPLSADVSNSPLNLPINSTSQGKDLVSISYKVQPEKADQSRLNLLIIISNRTSTELDLINAANSRKGFNLYTLNDKNLPESLSMDQSMKDNAAMSLEDRMQQRLKIAAANSGSSKLERIAPNGEITRIIELSPADLNLIKLRLFQLTLTIINPTTSQTYRIESSPKKLEGLSN